MAFSLPLPGLLASCAVLGALTFASAAAAQEGWAHPEVDDVPPPPPPPPPPLDTSNDGLHDTTVVVHVDATSALELQRRDEQGAWRAVCTAPCDRPLAEHEEYRVGGPGVRPSLPFTLEGHGGRVRVAAQVASSGWFTGGVVLAAIGATTAAAGVVVATIVADLAGLSQGFSPPIAGVQAAGITMIAVGAVALGCGIVALAENTESRVELRGEDPTSQAHGVAAAFPLPVTVPAVLARF